MTNIKLIFLLIVLLVSYSTNLKAKAPPLSVQLWAVRDLVKQDIEGTLSKISAMGFDAVEFANGEFGKYKGDPKGLKKFLDRLGMKASGAHISFIDLNEENFSRTIEFYQALEIDMLIVGWDTRAWNPVGIKEVVELLNELSIKLKPYNMKIGFHNHEFEFGDYQNETYWDYLAKNTYHDVILQQDVGSTIFAGKDPIEYVNRYPGRTLTTHYKARVPAGVVGKSPIIGKDTIDWINLLKANLTVGATKWIVVEQESAPDGLTMLQAIGESKKGLEKFIKKLK